MYLERQFDWNIFLHTYVYSNFPLITQVKYSQVPIKQVGPNKRIGWLFWGLEGAFFRGERLKVRRKYRRTNFQPYLHSVYIWLYSFMKFNQNNHPTRLFGPTCLIGTWVYSHLSNNHGGWNKRESGIFWKKTVHNCNKRGVEGGKNLRNQ